MRFLLVNADYQGFLDWLYAANLGLEELSYDSQMKVRNDSLFGVADFYSKNLKALGHEAFDVHINNPFMQKKWAEENGIRLQGDIFYGIRKRVDKHLFNKRPRERWVCDVLGEQIRHYRPDVILSHDITLPSGFWRSIMPQVQLLVGQHASPVTRYADIKEYDLILSSLPNIVEFFKKEGKRAELFRLGFEKTVLDVLPRVDRNIPVSFVGSVLRSHASRRLWLEAVVNGTDAKIWGQGVEGYEKDSPILKAYQGSAWGRDMYKILNDSRITLNFHIDMSAQYANNMRLYEATGSGALLVTDMKDNLKDMFEIGKEVVTYGSVNECIEKIRYYAKHEKERIEIAKKGQERTMRDHNYYVRMNELIEIAKRNMRGIR